MSLMNISHGEIKKLAEKLHNIKKYGANKEVVEDTLKYLIPGNEFVKIGIDINRKNLAASFDLNEKQIKVSLEKLDRVIRESILQLKRMFTELNETEMYNYYLLFALVHETRHVYQYLIADGYIKEPYQIVKQTYKDMSNIGNLKVSFIKNIISSYIYYKNHESLVIERNANIEATEIISNLANLEGDHYIKELFESMRQKNIVYGYDSIYNGSIEETYKTTKLNSLYEKLQKDEAIPIRDRILYGLPISKETKKKVLEYKY